jgi:hypothetical protein
MATRKFSVARDTEKSKINVKFATYKNNGNISELR